MGWVWAALLEVAVIAIALRELWSLRRERERDKAKAALEAVRRNANGAAS